MNPPKYDLTIVASNRNRLDINSNITKWFLKSLAWQDYSGSFEVLIVDGGSSNYNEIKNHVENYNCNVPMRMIQYKIGDAFERSLLNNVGIRNAFGEYVFCTDIDMLFGKEFVKEMMNKAQYNAAVYSRTLYIKPPTCNAIYKGELDPYDNLDSIRLVTGRVKYRTTCGSSLMLYNPRQDISSYTKILRNKEARKHNKIGWNLVRGYNETMIQWGSEDFELYNRISRSGMEIRWIDERREKVMLIHQYHERPTLLKDLAAQENNKKILHETLKAGSYISNIDSWGGLP